MYYQLPPLTPGWQVARAPAAGRFYYYNTNTGVVQWDMPAADGGEQGSSIGGLGGEQGSSIGDLGGEQGSSIGDLRGERHSSIGDNEAAIPPGRGPSPEASTRVPRNRKWAEDENVELLDLVQRVGLDGGWQAVEAAAKAGNVLTRRNVMAMQKQYPLVVGRLHKPLKKRSKSAENTADKENELRWRLVEAL